MQDKTLVTIQNVKIEKLVPYFKGLAHKDDGKAIMVDGAINGEVVDVNVKKEYKNYLTAEVANVKKASLKRIKPECEYFGICGGCELLYIDRAYEIECKNEFFKSLFQDFEDVKFEEGVFLNRFESRCRAKFHKSGCCVGFMERTTNRVVDIKKCPLLCKELNNRLDGLRAKCYKDGEYQYIAGLENGKIVFDRQEYYLDNDVFFQSNYEVAQKMLKYVCGNVGSKIVYDIYAGIGFFSSALENNKDVENIIAIEESKKCKKFALQNLQRTKYINLPFEKVNLSSLPKEKGVAIVDPPRNGLSKNALKKLLSMNLEKIIYVSCNIKSNINDIKSIANEDNDGKCRYVVKSAKLFDMYPATSHIEAVVVIERQ